jgi:hypothetical protein
MWDRITILMIALSALVLGATLIIALVFAEQLGRSLSCHLLSSPLCSAQESIGF